MRTRSMVSIEENPATPDSTLLWYSRAIGEMLTNRKFADPTSWRFQGAIHDYDSGTDPFNDAAHASDGPPAGSIRTKFWRKCQHASWFFLPWHRMYLYYFEQIVADTIVKLGGPAGWALPFWDYNASPAARALPWAFRQPTWPGGETNYLAIAARDPAIQAGAALDLQTIEEKAALDMTLFSTPLTAPDVEFGGPAVKNHSGGSGGPPFGGVESSPHNNVHVAVGGGDGWMIDPTTAALDPIFWLHHCNIDRLWEKWIRQTTPVQRSNPTVKTWTGEPFSFYDAAKKVVKLTPGKIVDTTKLDYVYEGLPVATTPIAPVARVAATSRTAVRTTLLGATKAAFRVGTAAAEIAIAMPRPAGGAASLRAQAAVPAGRRVLLHLEHVDCPDRAGSYDVFIDLPTAGRGKGHPDHFAGRVSMFGPRSAARGKTGRAKSGFSFVLNITDLYRRIAGMPGWDPSKIRVAIHPVHQWSRDIKVGRVSLSLR